MSTGLLDAAAWRWSWCDGGSGAVAVARVVLPGVVVHCYALGLYHEGRWRSWSGDLYVCIGSTGDIGGHLVRSRRCHVPGRPTGFLKLVLELATVMSPETPLASRLQVEELGSGRIRAFERLALDLGWGGE
jgi:hypothetical protein